MENLKIISVLTSNGVTIGYELSNSRQITLEEGLSMAKDGSLTNVKIENDKNGYKILLGTSDDDFSKNKVPHVNINRPSD